MPFCLYSLQITALIHQKGKLINSLLETERILELINQHYFLSDVQSCSFIRRGFNDHYLVECKKARYIFRVYLNHKYYIESLDNFQFELDLIEYLHAQNSPVAEAIRLNNGELLGTVSTELGARAFALFAYAEGSTLEPTAHTAEQCFQFGKTMAAFHLAANGFQTNLERYRLDLKYLVDEPLRLAAQQKDEVSRTVTEDLSAYIQELIASLQPIEKLVSTVQSMVTDEDAFGIIHGDLHTENVHFQDEKVTLFDFDHCGYGWRAYDLAATFYLSESQNEALLRGYESLRPLSGTEKACLPVFVHLRQLWNIGDMLATEEVRAEPKE